MGASPCEHAIACHPPPQLTLTNGIVTAMSFSADIDFPYARVYFAHDYYDGDGDLFHYGDNNSMMGDSYGEVVYTLVPEPGSALILGGLGGVMLLRRRRGGAHKSGKCAL